MPEASLNCPLPNAHRRLGEAHRLWHQAFDVYDDPEGFRTQLNALVQALRNVTFVLQKEKRSVPDFNTWYPPWQEKMKNDAIMVWLVDARNYIVKQGDLELLSRAEAGVQASWDAPVSELFQVPPFMPTEAIAVMLAEQDIPDEIRKGGVLRVERSWVVATLPDFEVLDALAHCYGVLDLLISDAHRQAGASMDTINVEDPSHPMLPEQPHGRLPCMAVTTEARTVLVNLRERAFLERTTRPVRTDPRSEEISAGRYRFKELFDTADRPPVDDPADPLAAAPLYMEMAKRVLQRDKYHLQIAFIFPSRSSSGASCNHAG